MPITGTAAVAAFQQISKVLTQRTNERTGYADDRNILGSAERDSCHPIYDAFFFQQQLQTEY